MQRHWISKIAFGLSLLLPLFNLARAETGGEPYRQFGFTIPHQIEEIGFAATLLDGGGAAYVISTPVKLLFRRTGVGAPNELEVPVVTYNGLTASIGHSLGFQNNPKCSG